MTFSLRAHPVGVLVAAVVVVLLAGATVWWVTSSVDRASDTGSVSQLAPAPEVAATAGCAKPTVKVDTAKELKAALRSAKAGAVIALDEGRYRGEFVAESSGTRSKPITLCGSAGAVLDGGGIKGGYVLHLDGADYWHLSGFTVTNGQKGVVADGTQGSVIEKLTVSKIGDEGIHLRDGSSDNQVLGNSVSDTGNRRDKFGEGIYIGTAESNWCDISDCEPDASDRNLIEGNSIFDTTAEAIDIKEGTSDGIVRGNRFDGSELTGDADSWVDVKGNNWLIEGNVGVDSPEDGFQTHEIVDGWGTDNVFRGNTAEVNGPGYGFALTPALGNSVDCDNTAPGAGSGLSNEPCSG